MEWDWVQTRKECVGDPASDADTEYVLMFNQFFMRPNMNSTYKAVFLRCLLDLGKYEIHGSNNALLGNEWIEVDGNNVILDLNFIAARLIKYYWDMDDGFKITHTKNRTRDAIIRIINEQRKLRKLNKPPKLDELISDSSKTMRQKTISDVINKQALNYLPNDMKTLFVRQDRHKIILNASLIPFLKHHRVFIKKGINYKLVTHLETIYKETPRIASKIDEEYNPARSLNKYASKIIDSNQQNKCFYCDVTYGNSTNRHIDHVIPFNYVYSTDAYNCVASCRRCNLRKHDCLPAHELFLKVIDRNGEFERRLSQFPKVLKKDFLAYDKAWYERTYSACLSEYHGDAQFFRP